MRASSRAEFRQLKRGALICAAALLSFSVFLKKSTADQVLCMKPTGLRSHRNALIATTKEIFLVDRARRRIRTWNLGSEGLVETKPYDVDVEPEEWWQARRLGDEAFVIGRHKGKPFAVQLSGEIQRQIPLTEFGADCKDIMGLSGQKPAFLLYNCLNTSSYSRSADDGCKKTEGGADEHQVDLCESTRLVYRSANEWHVEILPHTPPIVVRSENFRRRVEVRFPERETNEKQSLAQSESEPDNRHPSWRTTHVRDGSLLGSKLFLALSTDRIMFIDTGVAGGKWNAFELPSWELDRPELNSDNDCRKINGNDDPDCIEARFGPPSLLIHFGVDGSADQSAFLEARGSNKLAVIWNSDCGDTSTIAVCGTSRCRFSARGFSVDSAQAQKQRYSYGSGIVAFAESSSTAKWFVDGMGQYLSVLDEKGEGSIVFPSLVLAALKGTKWKQIADLDGKRFVATLENGEIYLLEPLWFTTKLQRIGKL